MFKINVIKISSLRSKKTFVIILEWNLNKITEIMIFKNFCLKILNLKDFPKLTYSSIFCLRLSNAELTKHYYLFHL
jgi:hypothetical protein